MSKRIGTKYVCPQCKEEETTYTGNVYWNVQKQEYELGDVHEDGYLPYFCSNCAVDGVDYEYEDPAEVEVELPPAMVAVCAECGSQDVELRRDCSWDIEKQDWVFDDWYSGSYCSSCERVDAGIEKAKVMP